MLNMLLNYNQYQQITHRLYPADYPQRARNVREILDFLDQEYQASVAAGETFSFWMSDEATFHTSGKLNRQVSLLCLYFPYSPRWGDGNHNLNTFTRLMFW